MKIPLLSRRNESATQDGNGTAPEAVGPADREPSTAPASAPVAEPMGTDRGGDRTTYRSAAATVDGPDHRTEAPSVATRVQDPREAEAERRAEARAATARAATARPTEADPDRNAARPEPGPTTGTATASTMERTSDLERPTRERPVDPTWERPVDRDHPDLERADRHAPDPTRDVADRPVPEPAVVAAGKKPRASLLATLGLIVGVVGLLFVLTGTLAGYGIAVGAVGAVLAVLGLMATRRRHVAGKTDALLGIAAGLAAVVLGVLAMTGQYDWPTTDGDVVNRLREWLDSQFVDRV
ncbi:thrombospondin [Micromonospora sp. NPDC023956]|uniref:thrombospondin n=1 Tax=Micromonospora sp. NPDC023956 TaxID=3155722 RepID=UPI0033DFEFD0